MADPKIAARAPWVGKLAAGEYWWCACGLSENQPWCDGSHKGTDITPSRLEVTESRQHAICLCKHAQKPVFCDGSHRNLPE